jgi:hypothetical protein
VLKSPGGGGGDGEGEGEEGMPRRHRQDRSYALLSPALMSTPIAAKL